MGVSLPSDLIGRFVFLDEMARFAKRGHKACREHPGWIVRIVNGRRCPEPCECAATRFKKVHDADTHDVGGQLFWRPFRSPEYLGFAKIFEAGLRDFQMRRDFIAAAHRAFAPRAAEMQKAA